MKEDWHNKITNKIIGYSLRYSLHCEAMKERQLYLEKIKYKTCKHNIIVTDGLKKLVNFIPHLWLGIKY